MRGRTYRFLFEKPVRPAGGQSKSKSEKRAMAIYHLTVKTGSRQGGQSAAAKVDYIERKGKYGRDPSEVLHSESGHMPAFAQHDHRAYWQAADLHERANGRLFKEVEFALPVELSLDQQRQLAHDFAQHLTGEHRLPYTLAIHRGDGTNPHCHLVISERQTDEHQRTAARHFARYNAKQPDQGGARKADALKPKEWLAQVRADWAERANAALERAGHAERIDHRSLEARASTGCRPGISGQQRSATSGGQTRTAGGGSTCATTAASS